MPAQPEREFRLPGRNRVPPWLWLVAIALHIPLALLLVSRRPGATRHVFDIGGIARSDSVHTATLPDVRRDRTPPRLPTPLAAAPVVISRTSPTTVPPVSQLVAIAPVAIDTPPVRSAPDLHPHYGDGRLWVRPMPESPRQIARALTGRSDKELTDSAVAAMVQVYLDAMAKEQAANPTALPSWTTRIGGKTVGLDSKWIYLGPIKIPTALLALLPINLQGNMSNYQYNKQLDQMRSDLFEAARRAATYDDFKRAVTDLHNQTEQAREFKKNQRTAPDTSHHG